MVQVPHVNHSIFERHELDLGKKNKPCPTNKCKMRNGKGFLNLPSLQVFLLTPKKHLFFLQGCGVLSETHAMPQQLLGCHDLGWYCGQHPGRHVRLEFCWGLKVIENHEKSWQIICFHCDLWKLQLFPHFFSEKIDAHLKLRVRGSALKQAIDF